MVSSLDVSVIDQTTVPSTTRMIGFVRNARFKSMHGSNPLTSVTDVRQRHSVAEPGKAASQAAPTPSKPPSKAATMIPTKLYP